MQVIQENNGNVTFVLEGDDADQIDRFCDQAQRNLDHEVLSSILDYFGLIGNAQYLPVMPEHVGALTDAPMFTDEVVYQEDGTCQACGTVWWYPGYEGDFFANTLRATGKVTFTKALH